MDVLQYNLVEKVPCEKVKYWAKQHERDVVFYLDSKGRTVIDAMFGDGKSMWISTGTKASDVDINTEIIKVIKATMEEPNSEWYAVEGSKLYTVIKLGVERRGDAAGVKVLLRENQYCDISGQWHNYSVDTPRDIALSLEAFMDRVDAANKNPGRVLHKLESVGKELYDFNTGVQGWHYHYSEIQPVVSEIESLIHLKISSDERIRSKYTELLNYAGKLYNDYQSLSR